MAAHGPLRFAGALTAVELRKMMNTSHTLQMIPLVLMSAIGGGLTYFLINQLPKKVGYPKFIMICLGYILFIGAITGAITKGIIGGVAFFILLFAPVPVGALLLRHELEKS